MRAILKLYRDAFAGLPGSVWRISFAALVNRAGTMVLPFASSEVSTLAGRDRKGEYMGWYTAVFSFAFVVGPPLGIKIFDAYGGPVLMGLVGAVGPLCWIACWYLSRATATAGSR